MNVLVLNAGSSSLKAAYFENGIPADATRAPDWSAQIRWTGLPARANLEWTSAHATGVSAVDVDEHGGAATALLSSARESFGIAPDIVGHRVVHGLGETTCSIIDARVRGLIEQAADLAPLHNRAALAGIDAVTAELPGVPQAADFDTAFHTTLAPAAAAYALPYDWFATRGIRRYGFHGISHAYCAGRTAELLLRETTGLRLVSAHLGNGCSLAAIVDGKSVETTMGFTPLEGVMMGSRSGNVDPGLVLYLLRTKAYDAVELDTILNTESGLKGISGRSEDVRDVIAAAGDDERARLAIDMYVHRLSMGVAAMAAAAGGVDALSFTGGVGFHAVDVRERVCAQLAFLGVAVAPQRADAPTGDREISSAASAVRVLAIESREEYAIARSVAGLVTRATKVRA